MATQPAHFVCIVALPLFSCMYFNGADPLNWGQLVILIDTVFLLLYLAGEFQEGSRDAW